MSKPSREPVTDRTAHETLLLERVRDSLSSDLHSFVYRHQKGASQTLTSLLTQLLPAVPVNEWEQRLAFGGVYLNGELCVSDRKLSEDVKVEYFAPKFPVARAHEFFPRFDASWIVADYGPLIFVYKPPGLPTLPTREQNRFTLKRYVQDFLGGSLHFPSRLDMSTCGIVPVSVDERFHQYVQRLFERSSVSKRYAFQAHTLPADPFPNGVYSAGIGRHSLHPVLRKVDRLRGRSAHTSLKLLSASKRLVIAEPFTGRTHQIRVHAQSLGMPIVGDTFYLPIDEREPSPPEHPLHLCCAMLRCWSSLHRKALVGKVPPELLPDWLPPEMAQRII